MITTHKSARIAALIADCSGHERWPAHYLGYFHSFNEGLFYEAHDVLEELWLRDRKAPEAGYYKGLIQFAGAFVHLKKGRQGPAQNLFILAEESLSPYPEYHLGCDLTFIRECIVKYRIRLRDNPGSLIPWVDALAPKLKLPN